ncbi:MULTISPECIES: 6-phosphogluconolactonase [unclassified Colwellia]|uniref:6-phosphogluconolactonase n=1 Tax=unclassified Colwellia TaxID=196834 RepID=UPI0015F71613|nr:MULTISPECIES: 6-phosphogluconolactonase [unclassified Colwellia]MBA6233536.1 6-phosphogluconolactonase [Colwellia sp. MB02u-7]MBA6238096.1 6-phosphogluconolactonase [Colwellia sp. MB02u-11]MBA6257325.1 6-phosphogluconolactonase [Colwellia sp. MB3u-28]MBA6258909.1 6-phosphogluconolactonase [Colwellia sp. MB3u-41]MBA6299767.1 6-phosphogluconolactonase [Colwellia sp. MB3u-22]
MYQLNDFAQRADLDNALAKAVAEILSDAISKKGKASLAVSGGSTPKGFFTALSNKDIDWQKVTVTLADERWVEFESEASNTRLVHENLLQNKASAARFFHLKKAGEFNQATLALLNADAKSNLLPLDVLILGMGEDGHTASLFPCSNEISAALAPDNTVALMKVVPQTAPNARITFTYAHLAQSKNIILHVCGESKKVVLGKALSNNNQKEMPIRAFLQNPDINTQVYWAE